ncbi:MAG: alpha/beta fold hydrolase [Symbiobacteriaceae bacterium]|nr:alpha/beta fold hydrolase [Symbiobacteriaceae bacterium]
MKRQVVTLVIVFSLLSPLLAPFPQAGAATPLPALTLKELREPLVLTIGSLKVTQGEKEFPEPPLAPQLIAGRTMLPYRYLVEILLEGSVSWNEATRSITATVAGYTVGLQVGEAAVVVDGFRSSLDTAPLIQNDLLLVPLRAFQGVVEEIRWDDTAQAIHIFPKPTSRSMTSASPGETLAGAFVQLLLEEQYGAVEGLLDLPMAEYFASLGGTAAFMRMLKAVYGELQEVLSSTSQGTHDGYLLNSVLCQTAGGTLNLLIVLSQDGLVAGIQVLPSTASVEEPYPPPDGFQELAVTVDAGSGYPLRGRLLVPTAPDTLAPLVILVQGSGATDYDETVGANRVFGQIAYGLAQRGIASLRYDKRNFAYPEISADPAFSIYQEYVEDFRAAALLAQEAPGVDREQVYILGHSLGGMLAPLMAKENALAGMILFAGSPRSLMDILDDQQEALLDFYATHQMTDMAASYREMQQFWRRERAELATMTAAEARAAGTVYGMSAYYVYSLEPNNALKDIQELALPTLILQGGADWQVYADQDYALYREALADKSYVTFRLYPGLNHLFMPSVATNIIDAMEEYQTQGAIPGTVFDDMATWILQ